MKNDIRVISIPVARIPTLTEIAALIKTWAFECMTFRSLLVFSKTMASTLLILPG